ncbi:MAG: PEP-CTERM sorting domain-containing protein [Phycisphaerae bacterium]|nr:PEP-CTERM sorting domain-containing protein [Phycisphaerae bacterium]
MKRFKETAVVVLAALACVGAVRADMLTGLPGVVVSNGEIVSIEYAGTTYGVADLGLGVTTRWYIVDGVDTLWVDGDPAPAATITTTSNPKVGDIGAKADNFIFNVGAANDISSIDGINFQQTIFPFLTNTIFVFERGGNDAGTVQAILPGGQLGEVLTLTANGAPYANTGVGVNGANAFGYVLETSVPVMGLRITASGHDALSISAVPEPASMTLLALGGLALLRRRGC